MNFQTVKKNGEIALDGCKFNVERTDGEIVRVTVTDAKGSFLRFEKGDWNSMRVLVKAKPKMIERFVLSGSVKGIRVREVFDDKIGADRRHNELIDLDGDLKVDRVEVEEDTPIGEDTTEACPF